MNGKQYAVGDDAGIVNLYKEFLVELNKQLHNAVIILCMDACSEAANATVAAASEAATAEIAAESTSAPFSMQEGKLPSALAGLSRTPCPRKQYHKHPKHISQKYLPTPLLLGISARSIRVPFAALHHLMGDLQLSIPIITACVVIRNMFTS